MEEFKSLKEEKDEWCSSNESASKTLEEELASDIGRHSTGSAQSRFMTIHTSKDYRE